MLFKFEVLCDDPYAMASGIEMNAFCPRCKCMSQSSGAMQGSIDVGAVFRAKVSLDIFCISLAVATADSRSATMNLSQQPIAELFIVEG